jgi:predicted aldo/keto reductase-like oxidoreductase
MTRAKLRYKDTLMEGHRADKCIDCNKCVEVCPQKIAIPEQLKKAHEILSAVK